LGAEAGDFATHVSIKALHYLIALAERLNFSRAANRCAVTQPTLSIQVRKLEEYLGVKLFERNRTRVVLTDDGEKVLRLARIVVGAADEILGIRRTRMREKFDHYAKPTQPETGVTATLIKEINYRRRTESLDSIQRESSAPATQHFLDISERRNYFFLIAMLLGCCVGAKLASCTLIVAMDRPVILQRLTCRCPRSCVPTLEAQYSLDVH
jgi:hypothetical protein